MGVRTKTLLDAVTATGAGRAFAAIKGGRAFQLKGKTSAGAGAVAVDVEVSNDQINWILLATISLVLSTVETSDGLTTENAWAFIRGNVTSISGTGANATLIAGD